MPETIERPLSSDEQQQLSVRLRSARAESTRALLKTFGASAAVCGVLMLLTLWLSDAPTLVIVVFWTAMTVVFTLWIGMPWRRLMREQVSILEEGIHANRVREIRVRTERVVEFEEEEDEGACYAFDLGGSATVFVIGQEFYEDDDFPNSDFSLVEILGRRGQAIDTLITKRGRKLTPERVIPAAVKNKLQLPDHLEVINAPIEQVESALAN